MKLTIKNSTTFKLAPVQSSGLPSNQKVAIAKGTVFQLQSHAPAPNNHVKVAIANAFLGPENRNTWYAYAPDIAIAGNEPGNEPKNETIAPSAKAVGGASQSRHLVGDAVDFVVVGLHPSEVYSRLDLWWGNRGGLASSSVFTHLDVRGYEARWSYGF